MWFSDAREGARFTIIIFHQVYGIHRWFGSCSEENPRVFRKDIYEFTLGFSSIYILIPHVKVDFWSKKYQILVKGPKVNL